MARQFNGTSDSIISTSTLPASPPAAWTLSLWVKGNAPPGTSANQRVVAATVTGTPNNADLGFEWGHSSASFRQSILQEIASGSYGNTATIVPALSGNTWYHIAGQWDGLHLLVYVNGVQSASVAASAIRWAAAPTFYLGETNGGQFFPGAIADVAFWSVALGSGTIMALANGCRASEMPSNMLIYWPILGQSPEPDQSGNGNNGIVTGTTIVPDPPQFGLYGLGTLSSGTILVLPAQEW